MPELPEVETVRRGLAAAVLEKQVAAVEVPGRRSVRRQSKARFRAALLGRVLVGARRRGKYLLIELDAGSVLVVHLRMSGQLLFEADVASVRAAHTHVVIRFSDSSELRFVDPRTFGELFVTADLDEDGLPFVLSGLGIDPLLDELSYEQLGPLLKARRTSLKAFLLDQREICGIGNIYSDEIAFAAKLRPDRRTDSLAPGEIEALCQSIDAVLGEAVELGGSSLKDARYRDLSGGLGSFQSRHAVYDRRGVPCSVCGTPIVADKIAGRSAHFCPRCQV